MMIRKRVFGIVLAAAVLAAACGTEDRAVNDSDLVPVVLGGSVTSVEAKAAVNDGDAFAAQIVASATQGDYFSTEFSGKIDFAATSGAGTFASAQYYPVDGTTIYMMGYSPEDAAGEVVRSGNTVTFTIDGSQDVMVTNAEASGSKATAGSLSVTFGHLLTQLQFTVKAENSEAATAWGNITAIQVLGQDRVFNLDLTDGSLAPALSPANGPISAVGAAVTLDLIEAPAGYAMIYPVADLSLSGTPLSLKIFTDNNTGGHALSISSIGGETELEEGTAYKINFIFRADLEISFSATVEPWTDGAEEDVDVS